MPDLPPHTISPIARAGGARLPASERREFFVVGGEGVRAEWQDGPKTPAHLQQTTATRPGRRWQSRHSARIGAISAGALPFRVVAPRGLRGFRDFRYPLAFRYRYFAGRMIERHMWATGLLS